MKILIVGIRTQVENCLTVDHDFKRVHPTHGIWRDDKGHEVRHIRHPQQLMGWARDTPIIEHRSLNDLQCRPAYEIKLLLMDRFNNVVDSIEELIA